MRRFLKFIYIVTVVSRNAQCYKWPNLKAWQLSSIPLIFCLTETVTVTYVKNHCVCGQKQRRIVLQEVSNRDDNLLQSTFIWETLKSSTASGNTDCYNAYRLKKSSMDPVKCTHFLALIFILLPLPSLYKTEECLQCNTTDSLVESRTK